MKRLAKRKPGRPRVMTAKTRLRILRLAKMGARPGAICAGSGISMSTLREYLDPANPKYSASFAAKYEAASNASIMTAFATIAKAIRRGDRRAAQWIIETKLRSEYGKGQAENASTLRIEIAQSLAVSAELRKDPNQVRTVNAELVDMGRATPALQPADSAPSTAAAEREAVT